MFYRHHIFTCTRSRAAGHIRGCCGAARGLAIRAKLVETLAAHGIEDCRANKSLCLDRCEHGPVMVVYPEGVWYRIEDAERDLEDIVTQHIIGGEPVARLLLPTRDEDPYVAAAEDADGQA